MKLRHKLIKENYKQVFVTNEDDSIKAAKQELLEMIVNHLPRWEAAVNQNPSHAWLLSAPIGDCSFSLDQGG